MEIEKERFFLSCEQLRELLLVFADDGGGPPGIAVAYGAVFVGIQVAVLELVDDVFHRDTSFFKYIVAQLYKISIKYYKL